MGTIFYSLKKTASQAPPSAKNTYGFWQAVANLGQPSDLKQPQAAFAFSIIGLQAQVLAPFFYASLENPSIPFGLICRL
jgi:hypothetical protein